MWLIIGSVLIGGFIFFQVYIMSSIRKTETQAYEVVHKEGIIEIRHYPAATLARIHSNATNYSDLGKSGFGKLARYIFGGNNEKKQIAMTAPVHMEIGDSQSTMSFVLPSIYNTTNLPKPNDSDIAIVTAEPEYVAAIQFAGYATTESIATNRNLLEAALKQKGISYNGHFRLLGYNPPYQLFSRRNELIVAINWDSKDVGN